MGEYRQKSKELKKIPDTIIEHGSKPIEDVTFHLWVCDNFPLALNMNPDLEYSNEEYQQAEKCFTTKRKERELFENPDYVISAMACLIRSINNSISQIHNTVSTGLSKKNKAILKDARFKEILNSPAPLAKQWKNIMNRQSLHKEKNPDQQASITIKNHRSTLIKTISKGLFLTLKNLSLQPGAKNFPFVIIGNLLNEVELLETPFSGPHDTKRIKILIERSVV